MDRRNFASQILAAGVSAFIPLPSLEAISRSGYGFQLNDELMNSSYIIPAPDDPEQWDEWRKELHSWRKRMQSVLKYDGSSYASDSFRWVTSAFSCCFIMICDSDFYDHKLNEYNVNRLIERGEKEYGGYDTVVLWHAYPRIGLDERNQFDFYRQMPGGLSGVKEVVRKFHQSGIRVFINYNPWDTGTRREKIPDIDLLIDIIESIDADGIFLDTMKDAPDFREKLDRVRPGIVMEGEIALPLEHIHSHHMSWAQWFNDSNVPGVYRNKWFERHHMQHAIDRWNSDKTAQLHTAWMNGSGMMIWENVFGQWLGWNARDKSIYRAMHSIQLRYSNLFSGKGWTPLSEVSPINGVYISSWTDGGITLRTLVNRNDSPAEGILFITESDKETRYFDLIKGEEIITTQKGGPVAIPGTIPGRGIDCVISISNSRIDNAFTDFLNEQKKLSQSYSVSTEIPVNRNMVLTGKGYMKRSSPPVGMVPVPSASLMMNIEYTFREPGSYGNIQEHLDLAKDHKLHSMCRISRNEELNSFAIDVTPVTNKLYKEFLDRSGYRPQIPENFLKHWVNGQIPPGKEDHPVVYVCHEDARAYAEWAGKRLPSEEEWQFAAQGSDAFDYPWGNKMMDERCNQNLNGETTGVMDFPDGASPFGCLDMCGNTWELTANVYSDGRTRFVMLKGGSCYKAQGSDWYFDGGPRKNSHVAKMLLIWPGLDRCSTVGFRCAADI